MGIGAYIIQTLAPLGLPVADGLYQGKAEEYIYFVIADDRGGDFGNSEALCDLVSVQIHYRCPWGQSYTQKKRDIRNALEDAGFTYPVIVDMSDAKDRIRHLVFECEIDSDEYIEEE